MTDTNLEQFTSDYIKAWCTTNADARQQLVEKVYSESAEFYADEPGDEAVVHLGWERIFGNISQVNARLVVTNGLETECTGYSQNHRALRISWQMKAPTGEVALRGMNFLVLNEALKIEKDYIFIN